ncbi:hypothetical protein EV14_1948 [Prochlorococcus sp. MIT 0703]|nr:hypothetical protein EV12_0863 [Prochlorococcus sp. MIT 0701]KGG32807.1 hypothetical protein EV14_1948 [Prochlorococcus sp. MIT 0703]
MMGTPGDVGYKGPPAASEGLFSARLKLAIECISSVLFF